MRAKFLLVGAVTGVCGLASGLWAGDIVGTVGAPKPDHVVVFVEKVAGTFRPGHGEMDQKNKVFIPYVLPIVQGSVVTFHNSDDLQHNVFGVGADEFNLGSYNHGVAREQTFAKPGEVDVLCNIHPEMAAYVLVLQNPYFARPDAGGKFHIADLPPGQYVLKAWYEGKTKKQSITVPAKGSVEANF